jgi:fatty acid desaturase
MDAFHSDKARGMWQKLPKSKKEVVNILELTTAPDSSIQIEFRKLRNDLEQEGWWQRDLVQEAKLLGIWSCLIIVAASTAHSIAPLSTLLLSLAMTNAGWLGHDYVHGVDPFSDRLRNFAALAAG